MPLRDLLKKKERLDAEPQPSPSTVEQQTLAPPIPEFTFVRTTTNDREFITPPSYPEDSLPSSNANENLSPNTKKPGRARRLSSLLQGHKQPSSPGLDPSRSPSPANPSLGSPEKPKKEKRRSSGINFKRNRSSTIPSEHVPENLPDAPLTVTVTPSAEGDSEADKERQAQAEARWEKRATLLANTEARSRSRSISSVGSAEPQPSPSNGHTPSPSRPDLTRKISNPQGDVDIQTAIRLHDDGELEQATAMFRTLANPSGHNNALGQVLYGLALQHGWGCPEDKPQGLTYLSLAAKNSASIESAALSSGASAGGAAKGELVLAIFEMAQCFRNGWGTPVDKAAARQYYETAANLGDADAMVEASWCYMQGFGGPKDKWRAAQYLRMAEGKGRKELGNTWIWKDKYAPEAQTEGKAKKG